MPIDVLDGHRGRLLHPCLFVRLHARGIARGDRSAGPTVHGPTFGPARPLLPVLPIPFASLLQHVGVGRGGQYRHGVRILGIGGHLLLFPDWVLYVATFNFIAGNVLMVYVNMIAVFNRRYYELILFALLNPVYWLMHSIAAYKGLWQLIYNPFFWEKTNHGLTKVSSSASTVVPAT